VQNSLNLTYYVLHRRPYRENSQIVDLFCEKQGRFSILHRVNKKNPALQPFIPYQMQFSGRGDLRYSQHVEIVYPSIYLSKTSFANGLSAGGLSLSEPSIKGKSLKGRNLYCGFYLNELIIRLTWKDEPQPELYKVYQQTLQGLLQLENDMPSEPLLRRFEFHLLAVMGYQYNWQQDSECRNIQPDQFYSFDPSSGFNLIIAQTYGALRPQGFPGHAILAIAAENWQHELSWKVAKHIARLALTPLLGDKPLASRELFKKL
jgi:DNA repair protein RecO (recombination protein O)